MKFSASNIDFNGPSLDLLDSRKPAHVGIKERDFITKVVIFHCWPVFCESGTVADMHGHAAYHNKH